jgi:5-methylcytosine-specific restriction enzyme A
MVRRHYDCPIYKDARLKTLKRDKRTCQMPGCKSRKKLHVHHIERWSDASWLRYEVFNLITLCKECHESINGKEVHYVGLFKQIIAKNEKK